MGFFSRIFASDKNTVTINHIDDVNMKIINDNVELIVDCYNELEKHCIEVEEQRDEIASHYRKLAKKHEKLEQKYRCVLLFLFLLLVTFLSRLF